jgi:ABC-type multidrug transport system ATPase subunit
LDTLVGGFLIKGISGGEKKRTSIAFELISDPQVLMLD